MRLWSTVVSHPSRPGRSSQIASIRSMRLRVTGGGATTAI
jgi:hypothetical protein